MITNHGDELPPNSDKCSRQARSSVRKIDNRFFKYVFLFRNVDTDCFRKTETVNNGVMPQTKPRDRPKESSLSKGRFDESRRLHCVPFSRVLVAQPAFPTLLEIASLHAFSIARW